MTPTSLFPVRVSERALVQARQRSHPLERLDEPVLRDLLQREAAEALAENRWVDIADKYTGDPERVLWLVHLDPAVGGGLDAPRWCGAVLRSGEIVACLRVGEARSMIRDFERRRLQTTGLEREDQADGAVLLRYRSRGVPGVAAVEVMRDGTARYVLTEGR